MSHTVQNEKPDWAAISSQSRTRWQRLAAASHGYVTPANVITMVGFAVSIFGLWCVYLGATSFGLTTVIVGRLADVLDGYVADRTKTKSPVGEAFDAGFDKLVAFAAIAVFFKTALVPLLVIGVILVENVCNVFCGAIARLRHRSIHPSLLGKYAAMAQWACLFFFVLATLSEPHHRLLMQICVVAASVAFAAYIILAIESVGGYARTAFSRTQQIEKKQ